MSSHKAPVKKVPIHLQSAQSRIFIRHGKIVNDDQAYFADIYIEDGVVKQIGNNLVVPGGARTIDARGKLVIPGGIDTNTHLQMPCNGTTTADDFYSGTKAALAGGTTMIIDQAIATKGETLVEAYDKWREMADPKVCCDYGLHVAVTQWDEQTAADMEELATSDRGVNSFQVFMAHPSNYTLSDNAMYSCFHQCKKLGTLPMVHAESGHLIQIKSEDLIDQGVIGPEGHLQSRPEESEEQATQRAILVADQAGTPLYVSKVMSKGTVNAVCKARKEGKVVFGEVTAAGLGTDGTHQYSTCWRHAAGHVTSPPLRDDPGTPSSLMNSLANNDVQVTGSDHCTFNANQKALGKDDFRFIPHGVNGIEDRMSVIWENGVHEGKMDPCRFVATTSTTAAKLFNLYPKKGRIAVGSDADIVIWNPEAQRLISSKTHHQTVDFNIFEGMACHGVPEYVMTNGHIVMDEGQLKVTQGLGRFVAMPPNAQSVYGRIVTRDRARQAKKIEREPYSGQVVEVKPEDAPVVNKRPENPIIHDDYNEFHNRGPTSAGARNMQDSSFALSGHQYDENRKKRPGTKVSNPPGGRTTGLW